MDRQTVFDSSLPLAVKLPPDGARIVRLRFPTDEEWTQRQLRRKLIIRDMGDGATETDIPNGDKIDAQFLAGVRVDEDDPVAIDEAEAAYVVERASFCEIHDVQRVGENWRVETRVLGGTTAHTLSAPTLAQSRRYAKLRGDRRDLSNGRVQVTINLAASGELYQKTVLDTEGYAGAAPIIHQAIVVRAVLQAIDDAMREVTGGN